METSSIAVSNKETLWFNKNKKPCWWLNQPTNWKKNNHHHWIQACGVRNQNMFEVLPPFFKLFASTVASTLPSNIARILVLRARPRSVGICHKFKGAPARARVRWLPGKRKHPLFEMLVSAGFKSTHHYIKNGIHPRKLTCPLKRDYFSREYIFQHWFSGDILVFRGVK